MKNLYSETKSANQSLNSQIVNHLGSATFPCYFSYVALTVVALLFAAVSTAQMGIKNFTAVNAPATSGTTYTGPGAAISAQSEYLPTSNNTFNYNFGTSSGNSIGSLSVNGYVAGNTTFSVIENLVTSVVMRRADNTNATGKRDILFFAGNRNPSINITGQTNSTLSLNLNAPYVNDMSVAFSQNNLLIGTDNIFANTGNANGNNNNIERVDVLIGNGILVPSAQKYGFPILERGVYGGHDAFKIAIITSLDALGNPSSYSKVVSVVSSNYNNTSARNPVADGTYTYFLLRKNSQGSGQGQGTGNTLRINQHITDQGIGGVAFRFADFGIADNTVIYGYSILSNDFNSTAGADVINYTNTTRFPTSTSESVGGLDLLAVLGIAKETQILPVQMTSFTAREKEGKADLQWATATESYSLGFNIERSTNGKDWTKIGFVASKAPGGNSTERIQYSYTDNNPSKGINYYRLKQTDIDDREKISETRIVSFGKDDSKTVTVFPNPVEATTYVQGVQAGMVLRITDMKGSVVASTVAKASIETVSTDQLQPGIYMLQAINNTGVVKTIKLVKR